MNDNIWYGADWYTLLGKEHKKVGTGWWVFWLIVFWPMLIIVAVIHTSTIYIVELGYNSHTALVKLDNVEYYKLQATVRQKTTT